ncbi:hypothetical protein [Paracoccus marcusii]|uniref:hypothetical protein n=1 Tax=Paracoccus marcusii TaxID=59779 RepID=UPI00248F892F|nr:hypothetical protein [Paracoccus marcusii]
MATSEPVGPHLYHHDDVVRELVEALRMIADTEPPSTTWAGDLGIRAIRAHARAVLAKIAQEGKGPLTDRQLRDQITGEDR